jgi:cyclase
VRKRRQELRVRKHLRQGGGADMIRVEMTHEQERSRRSRLVAAAAAVAVGAALAVGGQAIAQNQNFDAVQIDTVHVRGGVYMLVGAGGNTTIDVGDEGVLVVDTQFAPLSTKILTAIRAISSGPIRFVVNTHAHGDHIGGNEAIAKAGRFRAGGNVVGDLGAAATSSAAIVAHENVLNRLSKPATGQPAVPFAAWPTDTFYGKKREFLFNGEPVQVIHQPKAHTDGDSVVFFRRTDVVSTGDLFTTVMYPYIDVASGGTINGYIDALNAILDITVASNVNEGGTMVIPGHGRLSDEQDVIEYRDMVTIIRDRIREYQKRGMTIDQVKAQKPTLDFEPRYGRDTGFWTTATFVETIYKEMAALNPPAAPAQNRGRTRSQRSGQ